MAGYIGNKAVGLNVTTGDILGDVGVGGDVTVGDDLTVTDDAAIGGDLAVTGATTFTGKVGLGTAAPQGTFVVQASDAKSGVDNAGSKHLEMGIGSGGCSFMMTTGHTMAFGHQPYSNRGTDTNFTNRMTIESAGDVTIEDGNLIVAAGHGINFSAQTSANSVTGVTTADELLDHYEEGTWTPLLPSGGTVGTIIKCIYTRIGNLVNVYGNVFLNPTNNNTIFYIAGLPYASTGNNSHGMGTIGYSGGADVSFFSSSLVDGSSRIYYHRNNASTDTAKNSFAGGANRQMVFQSAYLI